MIYLHIPFCKKKCSYCNFHFSTSFKQKEELLHAIEREVTLRHNELQGKKLHSLYFGGGTPSVLEVDEIHRLLDTVLHYFDFADDIEITLEANPDDLSSEFIKGIYQVGINRLSIGTQSFNDNDLRLMNRVHNAMQAEDAIKRSQDGGFENISIDLIYGMSVSDFEVWQNNLQKTIDLSVQHVSSYALTIEPKTALENWIKRGKIASPKEEEQNREFYYMSQFLQENGFEHYEISNFGLPGFHSKHNSAYWEYQPYLGIGPSAHSYDGIAKRSWNIANNTLYIKNLQQNELPLEIENLSLNDRYNEMIMIGLRTKKGLNIETLKKNFPKEIVDTFNKNNQKKLEEGFLEVEEGYLKIPEKHWFFADGIAADLFLV